MNADVRTDIVCRLVAFFALLVEFLFYFVSEMRLYQYLDQGLKLKFLRGPNEDG